MLAVELSYEKLHSEYEEKIARGIPMSVHEQYQVKLAGLRVKLQRKPHREKLGEILLELGTIGEDRLSQALAEQKTNARKRLLGEILVDRGWVDKGIIDRAIRRQIKFENGSDKMDKSEVD